MPARSWPDGTPEGARNLPRGEGASQAERRFATLRMLADLASGGRLRKLLDRGKDEVALAEAVDEVDALVDRELADRDGWFAKAVAAIELQLTADVNPFLDTAIERFEATWRGKP